MNKERIEKDKADKSRQNSDGSPRIADIDPNSSPERIELLLQSLQAHQIELELQNDELKRAQNELTVSIQNYIDLYDFAPIGYVTTSAEGRILEANLTFSDMTGIERSLLKGKALSALIDPADQDRYYLCNRDLAKTTEPHTCEFRLLSRASEPCWVKMDCLQVLGEEGHTAQIRRSFTDITQIKQNEAAQIRMESLDSIGLLAAGIAHDLNNMLSIVVGNISLAKLTEDPRERNEILDAAHDGSMSIQGLTQQLLTFAKGGAPTRGPAHLHALLTDTVHLALSGSRLKCEFNFSNDNDVVDIDQGQIKQAINNLVLNAQQAMPGGGTIRMTSERVVLDRDSSLPLVAGTYMKITFEDEGEGIPSSGLNKIFTPFYSTKATGRGLGLATTYSIITKHDGLITVVSEVGVGTAFSVYLPASNRNVIPSQERRRLARNLAGVKVLVMDDQLGVRKIAKRSMEKLGCEVVTSVDGDDALEKYQEAMSSGNPFDLVLLDLTIPGGMGGDEVLTRLKELDEDVSGIVASGYSDSPVMTDYRRYGFKGSIPKPYSLPQLSHLLSEVYSAKND